jgi:Tol biopolymer transport system component
MCEIIVCVSVMPQIGCELFLLNYQMMKSQKSSTFIAEAPFFQLRRRGRGLPRMAAAIAALAMLGALGSAHATFPGENGVIVFESVTTLGTNIGKTAPISGSPITYLAPGGRWPVASPSGKRVAYAMPNAANNTSTIHVMNIAGTNDVQLTSGAFDSNPVWTPDGRYIAFIRDKNQLWTMNADGTELAYSRLLAVSPDEAADLAWNPDPFHSTTFAYTVLSPAEAPAIYQAVTGYKSTFLAQGRYPAYSPNGSSVLYLAETDTKTHEINANGSNDHAIPGHGLAGQNVIAPDGTVIAGGFGSAPTLSIRPRTGSGASVFWPDRVNSTDWSRLPQHCYETTPQGGGGALAGSADFYAEQCAVVVMPDGGQVSGGVLMQAAAIGPDRRLYLATLKANASGTPTWTPFVLTPGVSNKSEGVVAMNVAIAGSKDGSSQLVITVGDGTVYHTMRNANGTWQANGFQPLMNGNIAFQARDVAITINASSANSPGNAQVIANGIDVGGVYHRVRSADGSWTEWAGVPGATGLNTRQLAIAAGEDGNTYVLTTVVQPDGTTAQIKRQVRYANSTWDSSFVNVAVPSGTTLPALSTQIALTITTGSLGTAQLVYTDANGGAWFQERANPLYPSSWTGSVNNVSLVAPSGTRGVSISAKPNGVFSSEVMLLRPGTQ